MSIGSRFSDKNPLNHWLRQFRRKLKFIRKKKLPRMAQFLTRSTYEVPFFFTSGRFFGREVVNEKVFPFFIAGRDGHDLSNCTRNPRNHTRNSDRPQRGYCPRG